MTLKTATPYLILGGRAEQAIALYREALGATVETLQRFGDVDGSCPEARRHHVMHAALRAGNALLLMSDGPGEGPPPSFGAVCVALDWDDADQARRSFDQLAATGHVVEPLFDAPWGALFGVVRDAFGVVWMFNASKATA
ncbi:MAG: VOC family protein [Pseudomonadota bacterium]|nr:MAG: VOC family protein [Pseudomonadota bacterium]